MFPTVLTVKSQRGSYSIIQDYYIHVVTYIAAEISNFSPFNIAMCFIKAY